ncbi:MAG: PQQ-binding-like beta-propeller repeat protein [Propionibacteriales bacterium]|nr:PQQ-binding-like beta-propeller repeat protein [Propionibacteriales bacterium]
MAAHRTVRGTDLRDGSSVPVAVSATPGVVDGVGVVVASDDGWLRFLDRSLTRTYWERRLNRGFYAPLSFLQDAEAVLVVTTAGLVGCFGVRGELRWARALDHGVLAPVTTIGTSLLVATFDHRCVLLDPESGDVRAEVDLPAPWARQVGGLAGRRDVYAAPVTTPAGAVVCCGEHVVGLADDGAAAWTVDLGVAVKASPVVVDDERVGVVGVDGVCREIDLVTGTVQRSLRLGAKVTASPVVSDGVVVVGLADGRSVGIDIASWQRRWEEKGGGPFDHTGYTRLPDGGVVCVNQRGNAECRDPADGAFRWESSQVLGLPDHETALHTTPVAGPSGDLYATSYTGDVYRFIFRDKRSATRPRGELVP